MVEAKIIIKNKLGLHGRTANRLVKMAQPFESHIGFRKNNVEYNAKSIVRVLAACVTWNEEIELFCDGPDEKEALAALATFIDSGMGE